MSVTTCGGIITDKQNNILIVFGRAHKLWSFPKGKLEPNESHLNCAIREIKEETGLKVKKYKKSLFRCRQYKFYHFKLDAYKPKICPRDRDEVVKGKWVSFMDLKNLENVNVTIKNFRKFYHVHTPSWRNIVKQCHDIIPIATGSSEMQEVESDLSAFKEFYKVCVKVSLFVIMLN